MLSGFSWEYAYAHIGLPRGLSVLSSSDLKVDLPASIDSYTLKPAIPSAGRTFTPPSPLRSSTGAGILTRSSIGLAVRLSLRTRLTLIRLALIRNP